MPPTIALVLRIALALVVMPSLRGRWETLRKALALWPSVVRALTASPLSFDAAVQVMAP